MRLNLITPKRGNMRVPHPTKRYTTLCWPLDKRSNQRAESRPSAREMYLLRTYGLTESEVDAMADAVGRRCPACATPFEGIGKDSTALVVDHCHHTGKVRGVLCNRCNRALGVLGDSASNVRGLLAYIEGAFQ